MCLTSPLSENPKVPSHDRFFPLLRSLKTEIHVTCEKMNCDASSKTLNSYMIVNIWTCHALFKDDFLEPFRRC